MIPTKERINNLANGCLEILEAAQVDVTDAYEDGEVKEYYNALIRHSEAVKGVAEAARALYHLQDHLSFDDK
jgi:hypothetical protein